MKALLERARQGDPQAIGEVLGLLRPRLQRHAEIHFDPRLQRRCDPSDIVQLTLLAAQRDLPAFLGDSEAELLAWLESILNRTLARQREAHLDAQKRSLRREQTGDRDSQGGDPVERLPACEQTPSQQVVQAETALALAKALNGLPDDQAEALRLRYLQGYSLDQLAAHFQRSEVAVAGLLKRGLQTLRQYLPGQASHE